MNQSEFPEKAKKKSRIQGAIGFASRWLKNWRDIFRPITKRNNDNQNLVITFHSHF